MILILSAFAKWNGTRFMDDKSLDSPENHGKCALQLSNSIPINERGNTIVFIASDNQESAMQVKPTIK